MTLPTRLGAATLPHDCHTNHAAGRVVDLAGLRGWAGDLRVLVGVAERRVVALRGGRGEGVLVLLALAAGVGVLRLVGHGRGGYPQVASSTCWSRPPSRHVSGPGGCGLPSASAAGTTASPRPPTSRAPAAPSW